jgi:hypothetical protein
MSVTHRITQKIESPEGSLEKINSYTAGNASQNIVDETIADGQTNKQLTYTLDVSAVKSFFMVSDQDVTFETNDGTSPDDVIALKAGVPYVWNTDSYDAFLLGTDVTAIFITNASGATATLNIRASQDPSP